MFKFSNLSVMSQCETQHSEVLMLDLMSLAPLSSSNGQTKLLSSSKCFILIGFVSVLIWKEMGVSQGKKM